MTALATALREIHFSIPSYVLNVAFNPPQRTWRTAPISLDEQILTKIIRPRVLVDCDLVGGAYSLVSLEGLNPTYLDTYSMVYDIPGERTQYREIMSVLSIGYLPYAGAYSDMNPGIGMVAPQSMNSLTGAIQRVSDSVGGVPPISNAYVELIGPRSILVRDQARVTSSYILRCMLANDEHLNNLNPRYWIAFSKLCVLAVQAYIYNELYIRIDQMYLTGGQELGAVKEYVSTLSEANLNYQTYLLEKWQATAFMNDTHAYNRFIKLQLNSAV